MTDGQLDFMIKLADASGQVLLDLRNERPYVLNKIKELEAQGYVRLVLETELGVLTGKTAIVLTQNGASKLDALTRPRNRVAHSD